MRNSIFVAVTVLIGSHGFGNSTPSDSNATGCTDASARNYDVNATVNDGSCLYYENGFDISWGLRLTATIDGGGTFSESDSNNRLGVAPSGTYGFDPALDIPENPAKEGKYISLYFPHPEWDSPWGNNFTQDIVVENDDFFAHNLTTWDVEVISNMSGDTSVTFAFLGSIESPLPV